MPKTSIQRRLIVVVVSSQIVLAIGLVFVGVYFTRRQLGNAFDAQLHGRAMSIAALVRYSEDPHPKLIFEGDLVPPPLEREYPDLYEVTANQGRVIARSSNWPADLQPVAGSVGKPRILNSTESAIALCVWKICRCWIVRPTRLRPTC